MPERNERERKPEPEPVKPAPPPPDTWTIRWDDPYARYAAMAYADACWSTDPEKAKSLWNRLGALEPVPSLWRLPSDMMRGVIPSALDVQAAHLRKITSGRLDAMVKTEAGTSWPSRSCIHVNRQGSSSVTTLIVVEYAPQTFNGVIQAGGAEWSFKDRTTFVQGLSQALNSQKVVAAVLTELAAATDA